MRVQQSISLQEPAQTDLTLSNPTDRAVNVRMSAGVYRSFQPGLIFASAERWLSFDPPSFTLAPRASTTVHLHIQPAAAAAQDTAGEYLAAILIDQLPVEVSAAAAGSSTVTVVPRLAIPVYLQIQGRERIEVEIRNLFVSVDSSDSKEAEDEETPPAPQLRIDATLKNRGTVHARPAGTYTLFNAQNGTLLRSVPLGRTFPLLPANDLKVPTWLPLPRAGRYRLALTLEPGAGEILQKEISFEITDDGQIVSFP